LAQTDVGKILLEADLQLKKDTAKLTRLKPRKGKNIGINFIKKQGRFLAMTTLQFQP